MEDELTRLNSELRQKDDIIAQLKLSLESNASVHPKENTKGKDLAEKKKKIEGLKHELGSKYLSSLSLRLDSYHNCSSSRRDQDNEGGYHQRCQ